MNLNEITIGPVKTVADLVDLHESLEGRPFDRAPSGQWAFRGQPRDFGTLIPSFQRQFPKQSSGTAEIIESELIEKFREHYSELPDRSSDMPTPQQIAVGHDLRCLSVMQHYEIPTRLLDWSTNFWTSIYFACTSDAGTDAELWYYSRGIFAEQRRADPSLVALMDRAAAPAPEPPFLRNREAAILVELDPLISPRMKQQFAHHTVSTSPFSDHAPLLFELQERFFPQIENGNMMQRVVIDGSCKGKVLQFLAESLDITASTVFPDVVGLGRFLRWQFDSLRTMLM